MKKFIVVCIAVCMLSACTSVTVLAVDSAKHPIDTVCIERNDAVVVDDFLAVVEQGFIRHGLETAVYDGNLPESCEYSLWYTAERGWDIAPYLDFVELRLKQRGKTIGTATYRHSGGFGFNKWNSTKSKMNPVIDKLLAAY
jgi:hypothetical protein